MKLQYFLYVVIGSVGLVSTESWKTSDRTLQKHPKKYGIPYKKDNFHQGEDSTIQSRFEDFDNVTAGIPAIHEIIQNITKEINGFHKTEEKKFPLDINPLFIISNATHKLQETANLYPNHNVQKHTQNDVNYNVQELVQVYPNGDFQESREVDYKHDGQKQVIYGSTPNLRRVIQLGFIHHPHRSTKMNFLQSLLKDNRQSPVQLHGKHNTWKFIELYFKNDNRYFLQSDISKDFANSLQLHRDYKLLKPAVNLTDDFPELFKFKSEHENHSQGENYNNGIKSRKLLSFLEPNVSVLGMPGSGNSTESVRHVFNLNVSHYPKKREIFSKVNKHEATQLLFHNTKHNTKISINTNQEAQEDFGTPNEHKRRDVRIFRGRAPRDSVQFTRYNTLKELAKVKVTSVHRNKVNVFPRRTVTKTLRVNQDYIAPKPVELDPSHNMRTPVQLNPVHNMREPVKLHPTHNLQKPVQLDLTHDMRRPVQLHPSHDLRQPVKLEPSHNLMEPAKLMESHDLRWPIVEESDHDMRNPITEADIFRSGGADGKLEEFIKGQPHKKSKTSFAGDPLYELLYEDEFLFLKCSRDQVNFNRTAFNFGTDPGNETIRPVTKYNKLFNESIKDCGVPNNYSTDSLRRKANLSKWPWMVSLQQYIINRFWHKCAGSLINNLWVITAAHCVESRPKWDFLLQLGMSEDSQNYIERFIDRMITHGKFNSLSLDHDIALLRMDAPVALQTGIVPVCLPWKHDDIEKKKAVALTWRLENDSDDLSREIIAPVLTNKECEVMFSDTGDPESIEKNFICASFENGDQGTCAGESGGPLVIFDENGRWILAGIYSWGKSCRAPNQPEVYIRISRYAEWIEETVLCYEENINLQRMG